MDSYPCKQVDVFYAARQGMNLRRDGRISVRVDDAGVEIGGKR